tara:strand:+ start:607 stop:867 length:261 start_codon:yes stop_codon:yes gene_type:complete
MSKTCTVTMKLTDAEIDKIIWSMKSIKTVLGVFEIIPDDNWIITLDELLKNMEQISEKVKEAKDEKGFKEEKSINPKKEYIDKITG